MKKNILFMVSSMNIGGVEKSLLSLIDTIPKEKYDITILMLNKTGGFLSYIPEHIKVEEAQWFKAVKPLIMNSPYDIIRNDLKSGRMLKIPSFIHAYYKVKITENRLYYYKHVLKEIPMKDEKYDIAISYAGPTEIIDTYIAHKVNANRKIAWVHFDVSNHNINEGLYTRLYKLYDKVFVVSNEAKEKLDVKIPSVKGKTEVMLNVVSEARIIELSQQKCELDNINDCIKLVTVGRLSKEKGQDLAIQALYKLKKDGVKVKWYCIGEGNERKELENLIQKYKLQDEFILWGAKINPYPYIRTADIYVQPSRHEGYCLTLAEAKILNKPIITTDFSGAREQVEDVENGYIVNVDETEIYEKIKFLINKKDKCTEYYYNVQNDDTKDNENDINRLLNFIETEV